MREIKFRAWDKIKKQMVTSDMTSEYFGGMTASESSMYLFIDFDGGVLGYADKKTMIWNQRFVLLQFTGLHDKNGKEIYEGDVVKEPDIAEIDYRGELYCIKFSEGCFVVSRPHTLQQTVWEKPAFPESWEVIGNIFENKELLNDNKKTKEN